MYYTYEKLLKLLEMGVSTLHVARISHLQFLMKNNNTITGIGISWTTLCNLLHKMGGGAPKEY